MRSYASAYKMCVVTFPSRLNRTARSRRAGPRARRPPDQLAWQTLSLLPERGGEQLQKFRIFTHYFLDETYLLNKMRLVSEIKEIPRDIRGPIDRINALRNAVSHSYFPENRRQYTTHKKVMYQDADIYTKEGVAKFLADAMRAQDYLFAQAFGVNPADARAEIERG
jgi:hypothetical protein